MELWNATSRFHVPLWVLLHAAVLLPAFLLRPMSINTDLYSILPATNDSREVSDAEKKMSASTNAGMFVLVAHKDFQEAKKAASLFVDDISGNPDIENLSFKIDAKMYSQIRDFLFEYRYQVQDDATLALLRNNEGGKIADTALATVYAPFSFSSLGNLQDDPFLLTESSIRSYLDAALKNGMSLSLKDDVLTAEKDGVNYVLVSIKSRAGGTSLDTKKNLVAAIYDSEKRIKSTNDGVSFSNSGVPFHSYESSTKAEREIMIISIASMILSVLILVLIYRSVVPLVATVLAIVIGAVSAFAVTLLAFGDVHVFTLAFGTSLIGVSIDYALHFFTESRNQGDQKNGRLILHNVLSGVGLGLITTLISYSVLLIAPFSLLRQMALFSITGLLSMFATVVFVFPKVIAKFGESKALPVKLAEPFLKGSAYLSSLSKKWRVAIIVIVLFAFLPGLLHINFNNDIRSLYTMSPTLLESEKTAAKVLDYGSAGWYFIVSGKDAESLLQNEEALIAKLTPVVGTDKLGSYMCISRFLPSQKKQEETVRLIAKNLLPLTDNQFAQLGFTPNEATLFKKNFQVQSQKRLLPEDFLQQSVGKMTSTFWIGSVDGKYYSAVMPLHASDPAFFSGIAKSMDGVYFINKTGDISNTLKNISSSRLILLCVAYALMILFLSFRYGLLLSLKISRGPLAAGLLTCAILGYAGIPLNLFSVMGLVLIIGIGVDYSIFLTEAGERKSSTMLAVLLCMLTTVFSFGSLSFSSLKPVSTFGFTLLVGILLSFFIAPLNTAHIHEHLRKRRGRDSK
jgi:predicted exporter